MVVTFWLHDELLAKAVGIAVAAVATIAPLIALLTTEFLNDLHEDPAVGSGPIATVIQDMLSVVIYGIVTSSILL